MGKTAFIGSGSMARAIIGSLVRHGVPGGDILVVNPRNPKSTGEVQAMYGAVPSAPEAIREADTVVVAVKPRQVEEVLTPLRGRLAGKILLSVAAGFTFDRYEAILAPGTHHISTVPNTPVSVCEGIVVCERRHSLTADEWQAVRALLGGVGMVVEVDTPLLAVAGTVCGCAPAFVAMFIEALGDAAVKHGIPRDEAYRMVSQMVVGTGRLQLESGTHPAAMKDAVCSPGGTTIVGVAELERHAFRAAVIDAVDAIEGK